MEEKPSKKFEFQGCPNTPDVALVVRADVALEVQSVGRAGGVASIGGDSPTDGVGHAREEEDVGVLEHRPCLDELEKELGGEVMTQVIHPFGAIESL